MKKLFQLMTLVLIGTALFTVNVYTGPYEYEAAGITVNFPDDWDVFGEGDDIYANSPEDEYILTFMLLNATDLAKGKKEAEKFLQSQFDYVMMEDAEKININGMPALKGKGSVSSEDPETGDMMEETLNFILLMTPANNVVFASGISDSYTSEDYNETVEKIFSSMKATGQ